MEALFLPQQHYITCLYIKSLNRVSLGAFRTLQEVYYGFNNFWKWGGLPLGSVTVETGSYVGDGRFGESNELSLTFQKRPDIITISKDSGASALVIIDGAVIGDTYTTGNVCRGTFVLDGNVGQLWRAKLVDNVFYWLARGTGYTSLSDTNANGVTYYYTAYYFNQ